MRSFVVELLFNVVVAVVICCNTMSTWATEPQRLIRKYCFDCHDDATGESGLDLRTLTRQDNFDGNLIFENIATGKMPPNAANQPTREERHTLLKWLAERKTERPPNSFRRISRREFLHSVNDLLGTNVHLANLIPEDRGTHNFDSDRRIQLSSEVLGSYFAVADKLLDTALPNDGFPNEQEWVTNKLKDSHETYNIYVRDYKDGILFSWTRANNGNSYSFFFDNFDPPVSGWYELTFDAAKVGEFKEDISIQVHAGKYYVADDRPQPQRLLDVISLESHQLEKFTTRVFLNPGENVSVHCYSKHNWRQKTPKEGAYIRQLKARGPVMDEWPPASIRTVFGDLVSIRANRPAKVQPAGPIAKTKVAIGSDSGEELRKVIRQFAERAFSTKLSNSDLAPYVELAQESLQKNGEFVRATRVGLKAVLCSPRFLLAPGEHSSPSHSQVARLARILWLSVPDSQLLQLARDPDLNFLSEETLRSQIRRMLADRRSDRMIESICDQWLNLRSWNKVSPSLKLYPKYDDLLHHYLPIETQTYLSYLIRENMPVGHLIDSNYSFLNQRLAQHYGIAGVTGQQIRKVSFGSDVPRGGLLTMGSVLKVTTDGFDTSPILRGAWVSKNIVGTPLSPPPESVKAIEPNHDMSAKTLREQIKQHKNDSTCYACHKHIDPYGFALENFDATGQWREKYRVEKPHRGTFQFRLQGYFDETGEVDSSGTINGLPFEDVFAMKKVLLSDHRRVGYNFAKRFFEYAIGYAPNMKQRLALLEMLNSEPQNCRMRDLLTDVLLYSLSEGAHE